MKEAMTTRDRKNSFSVTDPQTQPNATAELIRDILNALHSHSLQPNSFVHFSRAVYG